MSRERHDDEFESLRMPSISGRSPLLAVIALLMLVAVIAYPCYWWFVKRIEVAPEEVLILIRKTGEPLPREFSDQVVIYPGLVEELAAQRGAQADDIRDDYRGIVYETLGEGRHFISVWDYQRIVVDATIIAERKVGILVRKYGKPLTDGKVVATEDGERGPIAEPLPPGRHNVNTLAYDIQIVDAVEIEPGFVGVRTLLGGAESAGDNDYLVAEGQRGVLAETRQPGIYFLNPYVERVDPVDLRSQTYEMRGDEAVFFPSSDSFTITVDGTIEWRIRPDKAPYVKVAIGDLHDIVEKTILPYARSISRIQGSKLLTRDFISGETRNQFQKELFRELSEKCYDEGIEIKAALVREIKVPEEIRRPINEREMAKRLIDQYESEIKRAASEADLAEQKEMQQQNAAVGDAKKEIVSVVKDAERRMSVALTEAEQKLAVAKLRKEAAENEAAAIVSRGEADADVIRFDYEARAIPLKQAVEAFGDGQTYARYFFLQKLAPSIKTVLSNTEGPFADIFQSFAPNGGETMVQDR